MDQPNQFPASMTESCTSTIARPEAQPPAPGPYRNVVALEVTVTARKATFAHQAAGARAAYAVSYEASQYGQGLLTYALLMKGAALT
jgi:hypothetical protein